MQNKTFSRIFSVKERKMSAFSKYPRDKKQSTGVFISRLHTKWDFLSYAETPELAGIPQQVEFHPSRWDPSD